MEAWVRRYPIDIFPGIWSGLEKLIESGQIIAPDEVLVELKEKEDKLTEWAKAHPKLFYALDIPLQKSVREILNTHPRLVSNGKGRNRADPFVIGLARIKNLTVVCNEKISGNPNKPKMPDVCDYYSVKCITMLEFIRVLKWSF